MEPIELTGQILGVLAVIVYFFTYQTTVYKKMMIIQMVTAGLFCIHYFMIDAASAVIPNFVVILRNIVYYNNDKKFFQSKLFPIFFAVIMVVLSIFSWEGYYSLFIIAGLALNTLFTALPDPQTIRKSILLTSPLVFTYDVFALSIGGMINETVAVVSSIIGIIRYKREAAKKP